MKNLTNWEKGAAIINLLFILFMGIMLTNAYKDEPLNALWLIPIPLMVVAYISLLIQNISNTRDKQQRVKEYNELRETIMKQFLITTRETLKTTQLVGCSKPFVVTKCKDCEHSQPHIENEECKRLGCIPINPR